MISLFGEGFDVAGKPLVEAGFDFWLGYTGLMAKPAPTNVGMMNCDG
jgi:hypothetical protein